MRTEFDATGEGAPTLAAVVAGPIASKLHNGGEAWVRMSWLRGLAAAGRDAWLFEQIDEPSAEQTAYFRAVTAWFGAADRAILLDGTGAAVVAPEGVEPFDVAGSADVLLNISGHLPPSPLFDRFDHRVLVDIDPGYTQIWHAQGLAGARVDGHTAFATIGENIGTPGCPIPTGGLPWIATRQPVCVEDWAAPPAPTPAPTPTTMARFTTVAAWRGSYGPVELDGRSYGVKAHEFRKLLDLPGRCPDAELEIALSIDAGDRADAEALAAHGWALTDPLVASATPAAFQSYVWGSSAELSPAQGVYVGTASGWFSDRTVRYLAAGRPVVVQDTGFSVHLPTGEGLLAFTDVASAAAGVAAVTGDYQRHADAARRIAEEHFAADRVVGDLLAKVT
jgi:hypothetical protein